MKSLVLVVEDEPILLELAQEILELGQIETIGAMNAELALDLLKNRPDISLVITDINMPGRLNGFEMAWLMAESWSHVPVLITSGHRRPSQAELPPGAQFLPKPWLISDFLDMTKDMILQSQSGRWHPPGNVPG